MKSNEKKGLIILILVAIIIIAIIFFATRGKKENKNTDDTANNVPVEEFVQVLENGTKLNTSTKLNEMKKFNGLEFGNIQFTNQNGQSVLLADVKNASGKSTELQLVDIILIDKDGKEIVTIGGIIVPLQDGESTQFNTSTTLDYSNAYDFQVKAKK